MYKWLHCSHGGDHDGKWGRAGGGGSPEVHDHLNGFKRVELQIVKTVCTRHPAP